MKKIFLSFLVVAGFSSAVFAATYKISPNASTTPVQNVNIYQMSSDYSAGDAYPVIEIIADYSGSLYKHINNVRERIADITSVMSPDTQMGLRVAGIGSNDNCQTSTELVLPVSSHSTDEIRNALYKYNATAPVEPLTLSLQLAVDKDLQGFDSNQKKKIILITDGRETCQATPCELIKKIMATRNDIVIDVIITPGGRDDKFSCLATTTGGKLYKTEPQVSILQNGKSIITIDPVANALTESIRTGVKTTQNETVDTTKEQKYEYVKD